MAVFYPIWRGPYMTINGDTYIHDMLRICGGRNVFADRPERYPTVTLEAGIPSLNRLDNACWVGAKCQRAMRPAIRRFISSGNGP